MDLLILDTHYGVVRYLYNVVFRKRKNQINALQYQTLFLSSINKYVLCQTGRYAHLNKMYSNLSLKTIEDYYEENRIKMAVNFNEWLNYSNIVPEPRIYPNRIDGPYIVDNLALQRYTFFWSENSLYRMKSSFLSTPFFCLTGIDYLHYELQQWKSNLNDDDITITIIPKYVFHETFYIIEIKGSNTKKHIDIHFLIWLDDVDLSTELYVASNYTDDLENNENTRTPSICLLKRLYIASDNSFSSFLDNSRYEMNLLHLFISQLSNNFIVTFDGKSPKITRTFILDVSNNIDSSCSSIDQNNVTFKKIYSYGYVASVQNQIYEVDNLSQLDLSSIRTPNFLIFQEEIRTSNKPTLTDMTNKFSELFYFLMEGMIDQNIFERMYMLSSSTGSTLPSSMKKQLNIIYSQKFRLFDINRQAVEYNSTFYNKTYIFSVRNLVCSVKSLRYLVRHTLLSSPLLPACVFITKQPIDQATVWRRITQNVVYFCPLKTIIFFKNFTINNNIGRNDDPSSFDSDLDYKTIKIVEEQKLRNYLTVVLPNTEKFDVEYVTTYLDVDLKRIVIDKSLKLEIYYFVHNPDQYTSSRDDVNLNNFTFKTFFTAFITSRECKERLDDEIYLIFMQTINLFNNNLIM